jgi:hypothetical protein
MALNMRVKLLLVVIVVAGPMGRAMAILEALIGATIAFMGEIHRFCLKNVGEISN